MVSRGNDSCFSSAGASDRLRVHFSVARFLHAVQGIQDSIGQQSIRAHRLLHSPECGFVLVTSLDATKLLKPFSSTQTLDKWAITGQSDCQSGAAFLDVDG